MSLISLRKFAALLTALLTSTVVFAASTAKEAIKEATAAVQKWQADAVLTHVSSLQGRGDGKADSWLYTFYSPKAKKSAIVTARDKKIEVDADVRNTSTTPLGEDFMDSDKAIEATNKAGLKIDKNAKNLMFGITVGNQAVGKPQTFWSVGTQTKEGMSTVVLRGSDGGLVRRDDLK